MRRVVITGLGLVTPLGDGVETNWSRLIEGESGAGPITRFDASHMPAQVVGEVPLDDGSGAEGAFNGDDYVEKKLRRQVDDFIIYGLAATQQAVEDAEWSDPGDDESAERTGVLIGSGIGGLPGIEDASITLHERGFRRVSPHFIPGRLINLVSGQVSIRYGYKGPNHSVVTACSTGAHAIGDAARIIALDDADVMIAGGAEAAICPLGVAGFSQAKALSTGYNETPEKASRPWDEGRDGFVMGEGAGIVVLEELEHAKARGAHIYGEVVGYGMSGDAHHVTAPAEDGDGAYRGMRMAMRRAGMDPSDIDYINAHGTSTSLGDIVELDAVRRLFGNAISTLSMSSTKSSIGHLLGAAGSVEAIYSVLAMNENLAPPTLNLEDPAPQCEGFDLVANAAKERPINAILSNSFGFGGTNASIIFKSYEG